MPSDNQPPSDNQTDQPAGTPTGSRAHLKSRLKSGTINWLKDTLSGLVIAIGTLLVGMILVQLGLATEGQEFDFSVFSPLEFWKSFKGLVVAWSQFNAWVLFALGLILAGATYVVYRRWKAGRPSVRDDDPTVSFVERLESAFSSLKVAGALGLVAALFLGAYVYQQYLWRVALPVPEGQIGVAFSRQVGSSEARDQLADYMEQMGHESKVVMRDLPVRFDATDVDRAQAMARRINADAVVIYREEGTARPGATGQNGGSPQKNYVAHIAFADPALGIEVPVPQRANDGKVQSVSFRSKEGVQTPRLEMSDVGRLMEATAGILMYDQDRYLPAIAHLRNAVSPGRSDRADGLTLFYLGNAQYLIDQEETAIASFDETIAAFEARGSNLSIQERFVLAKAYSQRADIHFHNGRIDQSEELLQKAVQLREPIDKDESALEDPVIFRRFHETFGAVYVELMDIAIRRDDPETQALWVKRAKDEAKALLTLKDDDRAKTSAIWLTYRTGDCEAGYKMAGDILRENPDDIYAHRAVSRLAGLRSGFLALESETHLNEIISRRPNSLPEQQTLLNQWSLKTALLDSAFIDKQRETVDKILTIDPSNIEALEELVSSTDIYAGFHLNPSAVGSPFGGLRGHVPTIRTVQSKLLRDPEELKRVVKFVDDARPYVTRWAQEVEPNSATPLVYGLRLSSKSELWLYNYVHILSKEPGAPVADPEIATLYDKAWQRAIQDGDRVLTSKRQRTPQDEVKTRTVLAELWLHRYFANLTDPAITAEAITKVSEHSEAAMVAIPQLTQSEDDKFVASRSYSSLVTGFITARGYYTQQGDTAAAQKAAALSEQAFAGFSETSQSTITNAEESEKFLSRVTCADAGQLYKDGTEHLANNAPEAAAQAFGQYVKKFPNDPEGFWNLGWAEYLRGNFKKAESDTRKFAKLAPGHPAASGNLAAILLAQGKGGDANAEIARMLKRLDSEPLALRLQLIESFAGDLLSVARDYEKARQPLGPVITTMSRYVDKLPKEAASREGARLINIYAHLGGAAAWAGNINAADNLFTKGLEINPNYVLLRGDVGFARASAGDMAAATTEYEKAIAAVPSYFVDSSGQPLEGSELAAMKKLARQELEAHSSALGILSAQKSELAQGLVPIVARLREAAAQIA
ncbi:MAG TPA: hypothetical protein VND22_01060 [Actinomycetota bacterium]|nr:hypothetical protein [Actinomycetota bacterium]